MKIKKSKEIYMNTRVTEEPVTHIMQCLREHYAGDNLARESLLSDLNLDSLDLIEGLFELENCYGKTLSNTEIAALATVDDLVMAFSSPSVQP